MQNGGVESVLKFCSCEVSNEVSRLMRIFPLINLILSILLSKNFILVLWRCRAKMKDKCLHGWFGFYYTYFVTVNHVYALSLMVC